MLSQLRIYTLTRKCIYSGQSGHHPPPHPPSLPSSIPSTLQRPASAPRKAALLRDDTKHFYPQTGGSEAAVESLPRLLSKISINHSQ